MQTGETAWNPTGVGKVSLCAGLHGGRWSHRVVEVFQSCFSFFARIMDWKRSRHSHLVVPFWASVLHVCVVAHVPQHVPRRLATLLERQGVTGGPFRGAAFTPLSQRSVGSIFEHDCAHVRWSDVDDHDKGSWWISAWSTVGSVTR